MTIYCKLTPAREPIETCQCEVCTARRTWEHQQNTPKWKEGAILATLINGKLQVSVQRGDKWILIIESFGETISHCVEIVGINRRLLDNNVPDLHPTSPKV